MVSDSSIAVPEVRRQWNNAFEVLRENNYQARISYPAKLSINYEGKKGQDLTMYLPCVTFFFFFLAMPRGLQVLSSPPRD